MTPSATPSQDPRDRDWNEPACQQELERAGIWRSDSGALADRWTSLGLSKQHLLRVMKRAKTSATQSPAGLLLRMLPREMDEFEKTGSCPHLHDPVDARTERRTRLRHNRDREFGEAERSRASILATMALLDTLTPEQMAAVRSHLNESDDWSKRRAGRCTRLGPTSIPILVAAARELGFIE